MPLIFSNLQPTSLPAGTSFIATTCSTGSKLVVEGERGNITTTLGSQLWLSNAASGETDTPIGVNDGVVNVNAFEVN